VRARCQPDLPADPRATSRLTYAEAIVDAMAEAMRADERVFFMGQDVGRFGGALQGSKGLWEEFGPARVLEAPIAESAMVGACVGAALFGLRPIVEISFGEFLPTAMSQIVLQAANAHYMTAGKGHVPLVLRTRVGDGPYRFASWTRGDRLRYEANPGYWRGMPKTARLDVRIVPDPGTNFTLLRSGGLDWNLVSPSQRASIEGSDAHLRFRTVPRALVWDNFVVTKHFCFNNSM